MREIPPQPIDAPETPRTERALPHSRRELADMRAPLGTRDLATRDSRSTPGTRSVTLARGEEDVILSASELAAAFQLDIPRQGLVRRTTRRLWRVTKVAILLAVLAGGGAAAAFYFQPGWYEQAKDYSRPYLEKGEALLARISGRTQKKPAALEDLAGLPPITPIQLESMPTAGSGTSEPQASGETPIETPTLAGNSTQAGIRTSRSGPGLATPAVVDSHAAIDALGGGTSVFVPTTKPATTPPQVIADFPKMVDTILARQEAARTNEPAVVTPTLPDAPAEVSKPPAGSFNASTLTLDEAISTAATLRTSALDAEARKDWAAAVLIYEQIARLPEGAHPSDLKVKLAVARERARS
jgi:hypothetical protein